jgi:AraC family transcriptional regulator of adaptative response / DNA-3-methyladenine glycosylase II
MGFCVARLHPDRSDLELEGLAVLLVERGEFLARDGSDETTRLAEGDVLVLGHGTACRLSSRRAGAGALVFRAQGEWLARALALAGCELASGPPRAAALRAGTSAARRAAQQLRALAPCAETSAPDAALLGTARAFELLGIARATCFERPPAPAHQRRSPRRAALAEALEKLAREPLHGVTLASFATRLGVSERQLSRLVRERLGSSFGEHVAELRIARAKRLLAQSTLAVIEVAAEAGFGSLGRFNHVFRMRTGETPSRYRAVAQAEGPGGAPWESAASGDLHTSARSSCFTNPSSQPERGTLPA